MLIQQRVPDTVCIFFDLQANRADSLASFWKNLAEKAMTQAKIQRRIDLPPETREALSHLAHCESVTVTPRTIRWLNQRYLLTPEGTLAIPLFASWIEHYALA